MDGPTDASQPFAYQLMNSQRLLSDEDLKLIELAQKFSLQFGDESRAPLRSEVERGDNDDLIEIESGFSLPDASQREIALLGRETAKSGHELALDRMKDLVRNRPAAVVGERQIDVVAARGPNHDFGPRLFRRRQ